MDANMHDNGAAQSKLRVKGYISYASEVDLYFRTSGFAQPAT